MKNFFFKNVLRYKWMYGGHMESHTVFLHTHDQKHLQNMIIFCFVMKLEQAAKVSNQTMDAVHSHDYLL